MITFFLLCSVDLEVQLEEQRKQQQVRSLFSCPQPAKNKTPTKRPTKRPRLQRPASTTTLLTSPVNQQAAMQPQQYTVLSPISLSSVGQPFTVAGLPLGALGQSSGTVTLLPAGSQLFTRYVVTGDGKADTITLHPSSGLTLVGTAVQDSGRLGAAIGPVELLHLSRQAGGSETAPSEGRAAEAMQEAEAGQEHTVIEINPAPMESGGDGDAVMVLSETEVTVGAGGEETQCHVQEAQTEGIQGLRSWTPVDG